MADIVVTQTNIIQGTGARLGQGLAGEAIDIGQSIAVNPSNSQLVLSQALSTSTYRMSVVGVSLSKAYAAGQPVVYQFDNVITFGVNTFEKGMIYVPSMNQGGIMPFTDMAIIGVKTTQITSNIATFTTVIAHPFQTGQVVTTANCGAIYNGGLTIASIPTTTTFTVALTHANDGPNTVTGTAQVAGQAVNIIGIAQDTSVLKLGINNSSIVR